MPRWSLRVGFPAPVGALFVALPPRGGRSAAAEARGLFSLHGRSMSLILVIFPLFALVELWEYRARQRDQAALKRAQQAHLERIARLARRTCEPWC